MVGYQQKMSSNAKGKIVLWDLLLLFILVAFIAIAEEVPADVVISAVYPDAVNESASEWIELYLTADGRFLTGKDNPSWPAADLEDEIALRNGDGWCRLNNSGSIVERWLRSCTRQTNSMIAQFQT